MQLQVEQKVVEDEIKYLNIGQEDHKEFFSFEPTQLGLSFRDNWESKAYKIAGFTIYRSLHLTVYNRETYDLLAFLGDVGGLEGIIIIMGSVLIGSLTSLNLSLHLMPSLFYERGHLKPSKIKQSDYDPNNIRKNIHRNFARRKRLVSPGLLKAIFVSLRSTLFCKSESKRFKRYKDE